jgi:nitrous oxidase accessory protein NosD
MVKKFLQWGSSLGVMSAFVLSLAFVGSANAATTSVACADLPAAIATATAGDTLNVTGNCTITTNTVIDKQLTINGVGGATISTSGTTQIFTLTADGTTMQNLNFVKTDKTGVQNIIGIQGDNISILNNTFTGQYVLGDPEVSRALEVSTVSNVTINGNTFTNLRQPAYINDLATGTINDNYVDGTRGFVLVANTDFTFSGNSWGNNAVDIAFIPGTPNNYPCEEVRQIIRDNNNAQVDNQAQITPCPTYPTTKDSCKDSGYKTFTGMTFKNQGACVSYVASNGKSGGNQ